jgi:hypothetical protein
MYISRRRILGLLPFVPASLAPPITATAGSDRSPRHVLGYQLHDDHSIILLKRYARSLALQDERARFEAQKMFHKAEQLMLDRQQVPGYGAWLRWDACVKAHENDNQSPAKCQHGG